MNTSPSLLAALDADPLASLRMQGSAIADLAFGSLSRTELNAHSVNRHLALLPPETLELDLSDPAQRQFGDYELLELIGEGGMGVVYRARQTSLDREVAVKLLAAGPWASREFVERFRREAQNAARMQHPNIVAIYEVGSAEELHFFSMRLICGQSLAGVIKREGTLPAQRAATLLRTIAEAVDYAHRLGVLHLDLKPANVLLEDNGIPHVADFGLARRIEQGLAADNDEVSGTPSYMAPEQATVRSQKITPATDIWGLGAILYELITAQPPFLGESAQATLKLVAECTLRSPRELATNLPRDLEAIILKCMARDTTARYPTARALADDLGRFIENRPVQARPLNRAQRTWRWARRQPYIATFGLLFMISMIAGIIGVTTQWKRAESNAATSSERLWDSRRDAALRLQVEGKGYAALQPLLANIDEQERAGKRTDASVERHEVGAILGQGPVLIDRMHLTDGSPIAVEISPDGSLLALALTDLTVRWFDTQSLTELGRVDLLGLPTSSGRPEMPVLLRFIDNRRLRVSTEWPDFIASPIASDTHLIDLERREILALPAEFEGVTDAAFSPDGNYALLHNWRNEIQMWRTQPWRALSAKVPANKEVDDVMLGRNARFVAGLGPGMLTLNFYDPHDLGKFKHIALPPTAGISAWAESGDGAHLAFGDFEGRVFLLDLASQTVRQLPTPAGREVTWVAFSEDDAWVAAVRWDGAAYAFDVATGNPLIAGQMQHDFELRHVALSHRERLLIASGRGTANLWRLPETGPTAVEAARAISSPMRPALAGPYALGFSPQTGLLATAELDGEVCLWRAPASPILPAKAALHIPGALFFDGQHLADVEYNKLRVVTTNGVAQTPWIELPQPVGFAELIDAGHTLVATSGTELHVLDAETLKPRYPPVTLPANPMRLATSADGAIAVLAFGSSGNSGFEEKLESYDLKTGQQRAASLVTPGPLRQFELSPDGARLLAVGPTKGATEVFEAGSLHRLGSYSHDPATPVIWAAFSSESSSSESSQLLLVTRGEGPRDESASLVFWDPVTNAVGERRPITQSYPVAVTTARGVPFVAGRDRDVLDPGGAGEHGVPPPTRSEVTSAVAVSHDGHLIAHAYRYEVQLYDAATATAVGAPLRSGTFAIDVIAQLAFAPDDRQLLARTIQGQWLLWTVPADTRPAAQIHLDADLFNAGASAPAAVQEISPAQRKALRQRDPGAWRMLDPRPTPPSVRTIGGVPIPARAPGTSPLLLDLTSVYDNAPGSKGNLMNNVIATMRAMPLGVVRLDSVDYDVRGFVQLHEGSSREANIHWLHEVNGIRTPETPIAAFHVLLYAGQGIPQPDEADYAQIRVHYHDGSMAVLPLRTQRDVPGWSDEDRPVPLAWAFGDHLRLMGYTHQQLISNPRLPNPHPERRVDSIDIGTSPGGEERPGAALPSIFAVTVEPVISPEKSGIK